MTPQEIATSISTLYFLLRHEYSEDLTHQSVRVLQFVSKQEVAPRIEDIRQYMSLSPNATSEMIKRLASKGLLERQRSKTDERVVEVAMTKRGRDVLRQQTEMNVTKLARCINALGEREKKEFSRALGALAEAAQTLYGHEKELASDRAQ